MKNQTQTLTKEIYIRFDSESEVQVPWYFDPNTFGSISAIENNYKVAYDHYCIFKKNNRIRGATRALFYQYDHFGVYVLIEFSGERPSLSVDNSKFNIEVIDDLGNGLLIRLNHSDPKPKENHSVKLKINKKFCYFNIGWDMRWNIEEKKGNKLSGWIFNLNNPIKPVRISIVHNEELVKNFEPKIERNDVSNVFSLPRGRYGFVESTPASKGIYRESFYISGTSIELSGGKNIFFSTHYTKQFNEKLCDYIESFESKNLIERNYVKKIAGLITEATFKNYISGLGHKLYMQLPTADNAKDLSIIIPVYDGYDEVRTCINSVLSMKSDLNLEIIIGYDCGPNSKILTFLKSINNEKVKLIINKENLGFVKNVNNLIKNKKYRDFLLLNADTVVPDNIFDRMMAALNADRSYASITPLSNNATIFSYLNFEKSNINSVNDFLFHSSNHCVETPVGHGFCMLINGDVYQSYGMFNEEAWGKGYGEEVDWCLAVVKEFGLKHGAYLGGIVYHEGSVSFGQSRMSAAVEVASKKIEEIYPGYERKIQKYATSGILNNEKIKIDAIYSSTNKNRVKLYLTHSFGGGVEKYIQNILKKSSKNFDYVVGCLIENKFGEYWRFAGNNLTERYFDSDDQSSLLNWLRGINVESVVVEHLGNSSPEELFLILAKLDLPTRINLHDYSYLCPRINLVNYESKFCGAASAEVCEFCLDKAGVLPPARKTFEKIHTVESLRRKSSELLQYATEIHAPSISTKRIYNSVFKNIKIKVTPHHRDKQFNPRIPISRFSKAICIIGAISEPKGLRKYKELADYMLRIYPEFKLIFIGYTEDDSLFNSNENVIITGKYDEKDLKELITKFDPYCSLFFPLTPETFSYTLSEALDNGLFPFYYNLGAIGDRLTKLKVGAEVASHLNVSLISKMIVDYHKKIFK